MVSQIFFSHSLMIFFNQKYNNTLRAVRQDIYENNNFQQYWGIMDNAGSLLNQLAYIFIN